MANGLTARGTLAYNNTAYLVRVDSFRKGEMSLRMEVKDSVESYRRDPKRITYNMGNWASFNYPMPKNCSFVDVVKNKGVEQFLQETGLAKPFIRNNEEVVRNNGNEWYPVYQFDERLLSALDPAGYGNYSRSYDAARHRMERRAFQSFMGTAPYEGGKIENDTMQL